MKSSLDILFDIIAAISTIFNLIIVYLVYRLTKKDLNPKLYVQSCIEDAGNKYDKGVNAKIDHINFDQKGFPEIGHNTLIWKLKLLNNGELPATKVKLKYSIIIQKAEFDYGIEIHHQNL
jgi:hypothetical protein